MTTSTKTALIRKLTLAVGALVVSTMTLASAADAKSNISIHLGFGGGYWGGAYGYGPVWGYGTVWAGPNCYKYWKKYKKTGKYYWKNKYWKCKAMYY